VQKESIQYRDGITTESIPLGSFKIKLIKPQKSAGCTLPVIFYIHGGGWVVGSPDAFGRLLGDISKRVEAAVFAINYTLSPEAKYPTALDQVWDAFEYILSDSDKHNVYVLSLRKMYTDQLTFFEQRCQSHSYRWRFCWRQYVRHHGFARRRQAPTWPGFALPGLRLLF
jgi:hypothetical protein